jgi:small redox-active disulfide protein 2
MKFFGKKEKTSCCSNANNFQNSETEKTSTQTSQIKILGSGCSKCRELEANTKEALIQLNIHETIEHVTDFSQIASYGVMTTPALVMDNKVLSYGRVLKTDEIKALIEKERKINE